MKKWFTMVMCVALLFCGTVTEGFASQAHTMTANLLNDWVAAKPGAIVYRDPELEQPWICLNRAVLVKRRIALGDCTAIMNGKHIGYIANKDLSALKPGEWFLTSRNTRAYQLPSLKSRSIGIQKGTAVQLIGIIGSCAMVRRGDAVGYIYAGHLKWLPYGEAVSAAQ